MFRWRELGANKYKWLRNIWMVPYIQAQGYLMDLALAIVSKTNLTYSLHHNFNYGRTEEDLAIGMYDVAVADFTFSKEREKLLDFSIPFMDTGLIIVMKKPTDPDQDIFSFLSPLSMRMWVYIFTSYIIVSFLLFLITWFLERWLSRIIKRVYLYRNTFCTHSSPTPDE